VDAIQVSENIANSKSCFHALLEIETPGESKNDVTEMRRRHFGRALGLAMAKYYVQWY